MVSSSRISKKSPVKDIGISGRKYFYLLHTLVHEGKRYFYVRNPNGLKYFDGKSKEVPEEIKKILEEKNFLRIPNGNIILDED